MDPEGLGTVLFSYSLLLTRGLERVQADMDTMVEQPTLIGRHDYASQEFVNLLLCGRAHSNVFNGERDMDGLVLRGIPTPQKLGMLTLFEHYGYVKVGSNLKDPRHPIWVLCSESHYSVMFSPDQSVLQNNAAPVVDVHYYDQLGRQDTMYRLSIETRPAQPFQAEAAEKANDLTPPIDHVIRTRWPGAQVDWNGSDPLL